MRFEFEADSRETVIRAILEEGDSVEGERQEASGDRITYSGHNVIFDYPVESIHPDLLGLVCLIIFYPFIGRDVTFPNPVSPRLEQAFSRASFKTRLRFMNVDDTIEMYSGSIMALSFGGGIDSSAVRRMFPDAFVVHEAHVKDNQLVPSRTADIVRRMGSERGRVVLSNQRYLSDPGGWHSWACSTATSLLMATDCDFGVLLTGSNLGNTLLRSGSAYFDRFAARTHHGITGNYWQSAFNAVGIPMFSPVCGASEFLTMMLSLEALHAGEVVYCTDDQGDACLRCLKCFRRDVIRTVVDSDYSADWGPYDRSTVYAYLENRPLHFGHAYSYARDRSRELPRFVASRLRDLPDVKSDWPMKVHAGTFKLCAEEWRDTISERVLRHLDPMEPGHVAELEAWHQSRRRGRVATLRGFGRGAARRIRGLARSRRSRDRIRGGLRLPA